MLENGFQAAVRLVRDVLQLADLDVFAVDAPDMVIPSWGCGGYTYSARSVVLAVDSSHLATASEFAHQSITDDQVRRLVESLDEDPADDGRWFFHAGDMPLWLGYTVGYRWARRYARERGLSASALVNVAANEVTRTVERGVTN